MNNIIEINNLRKTYRNAKVKTQALRGINVSIAPGEFIAIMGASGSGKSTLMNVIGLLDNHFEGSYILNGQDVSKLSDNQLSEKRNEKIGFIFQQYNLLKRSTVLQNVLLPTIYNSSSDDEARAIQMIKRVGIVDRIDYKGNELSGGQIQRVAIARALIMNPSILLADEPTGNLDSVTSKGIMEIFKKINNQGTTIILITHEKNIASYANKIVYMKDGLISKEANR